MREHTHTLWQYRACVEENLHEQAMSVLRCNHHLLYYCLLWHPYIPHFLFVKYGLVSECDQMMTAEHYLCISRVKNAGFYLICAVKCSHLDDWVGLLRSPIYKNIQRCLRTQSWVFNFYTVTNFVKTTDIQFQCYAKILSFLLLFQWQGHVQEYRVRAITIKVSAHSKIQ